jgi:thiamine monophosphate synthase
VVAIGGVTMVNAAAVASSGAAMGAVISALAHAGDPQTAARDLHAALRGA